MSTASNLPIVSISSATSMVYIPSVGWPGTPEALAWEDEGL
jgi:hypothetical protein